ncbi:MAG TPA: TetR/AcrR family transcriptional regulator [Gemmatimonadales bacterium]|jgi:AcrR family transcriptional regulator|nr:TetR/AcrR family transcriptional regulator [Gemmatimonadales bacterium]
MSNPTPSRRDGEATRQRLLRAALDLYTTIGFRATTTPAIAARAGVAEGTIYRHFSGKEHLLNEVYRNAQRWGAGLVKEPESNGQHSVPDRLGGIARRLLDAAAQDPSLTRMLLRSRDEQHLDEGSREASREFREALQQVVAGGETEGVVRQGPAELWTDVWLALVAFAAERVGAKEWDAESPHIGLTLDAAWDAIAARR